MTEFWRSTVLPHLEVRRSRQESPCYRPHFHDHYSIGLIVEGTSILSGPLQGTICLEPGDVVVIPAEQVHACNPDKGRWVYQMIHMDQEWTASIAPTGDASPIFMGIRVVRHPSLPRLVEAFSNSIFADATRERIEADCVALLQELESGSPNYLVNSTPEPELVAVLEPVMERLRNDESNPSLEELADLVSMSKYQLVRSMRRATGLTPLAWRQNTRIIQARHLLLAGQPIAETAHSLGFTDQSHFHRVFRSHVAASPGAYRN